MKKQKGNAKYKASDYENINFKKNNLFWNIIDRLSSTSSFVEEIHEKTVGNEYRKEIDEFDLSKSKKILHIGCGAYPISALVLAELKGVKIVAIDNKEKLVKNARKVLEQKNMNGKISVEIGEGINYPLKGFDTIIVSGCSTPRIQIINHVLQNSDKKSIIIIRESYYKDKLIKELIKNIDDVELIKKINNHAFITSNWESFYVIKK